MKGTLQFMGFLETMIMLLIMGNFKKENLSSSELNCFCFYIKVGYFFLHHLKFYICPLREETVESSKS